MTDTALTHAQEAATAVSDAAVAYAEKKLGVELDNLIQPHQRAEVFALATVFAQTMTAVYVSGE